MEPLVDVRARGDGESVNSVSVKSPAAGSQMNNNFVSLLKRSTVFISHPGLFTLARAFLFGLVMGK